MQGKIIKGIAGFYYVDLPGKGIYECKAKGGFRKQNIKPLPGDNVTIQIIDEEKATGNICQIHPRENALIRPAVANIDQVLVEFAAAKPNPNLNLLDRFLIMMEKQNLPCILFFNKIDEAEPERIQQLQDIYTQAGYPVIMGSVYTGEGIDEIRRLVEGRSTAFAGPSGVGKSSLLNALCPQVQAETGEISAKIQRGKHTTRHTELIAMGGQSYLIDTPGFSTLYLTGIEKEELRQYYPEFQKYEGNCRFFGCTHTHEPDCALKKAVEYGELSQVRYKNYIELYDEIKQTRSW